MSKQPFRKHLVCDWTLGRGALIFVGFALGCASESGEPSNTGGGGSASGGAAGASAGSSSGGSGGTANGNAGSTAGGQAGAPAGGMGGTGGAVGGMGGSGGAGGATGGMGGSGGAGGAAGGMGGSGGGGGDAGGMGGSGGTAPFELTSTAFMDDEVVPLQYKCAQPNNNPPGMNQSPPLSWGPGPEGTMSYAIAMRHLDVPYHWVIWDIPANVTSLPEDIDHEFEPADVPGAKQTYLNGLDDFTGFGYLGPCPQATNSEQSYEFSLYALDVATIPGLTGMVSPDQALAAVEDNMVDGSEAMLLIGRQTRVP